MERMKKHIRLIIAAIFVLFGLWVVLTQGQTAKAVETEMPMKAHRPEPTDVPVEVIAESDMSIMHKLAYVANSGEESEAIISSIARAIEETEAGESPKSIPAIVVSLEETNEHETWLERRDRERKEEGLVVLEDGSVLYMTLEDVKTSINLWYTNKEIDELSLMVAGEDGGFHSQTIWAADVWVVLNRIGKKGFSGADSIHNILYSGAFDAVTSHSGNMDKAVRPEIREIVVDVLARKVYEDMGAPEEIVGRVLPEEVCFFRNPDYRYEHNHYYYTWDSDAKEYDPFTAPFNPYT